MIDFDRIVTELVEDNRNTARGRLLHVADVLLTWWRAAIDVRTYGAVKDGKPNPSVKVRNDAAALLWGKSMTSVAKEGAIKYLEEETRNGTEEPINSETTGGRRAQTDDADPSDLPGRGVGSAAVDCGSAMVLRDVGCVSRKGRRPGVSKIPAHLRS